VPPEVRAARRKVTPHRHPRRNERNERAKTGVATRSKASPVPQPAWTAHRFRRNTWHRLRTQPGGELAPADPATRTRHETLPHPRRSPTVPGGVQRDLPAFPARRHRLTADDYRTAMTDRFATWNDITRSSKAAW